MTIEQLKRELNMTEFKINLHTRLIEHNKRLLQRLQRLNQCKESLQQLQAG